MIIFTGSFLVMLSLVYGYTDVRKIQPGRTYTPSRVFTSYKGISFNEPMFLTTTNDGHGIIITDHGNARLVAVDRTGKFSSISTSFEGYSRPWQATAFGDMIGICDSDGFLLAFNGRIRMALRRRGARCISSGGDAILLGVTETNALGETYGEIILIKPSMSFAIRKIVGAGKLRSVRDVFVTCDDDILVADDKQHKLFLFDGKGSLKAAKIVWNPSQITQDDFGNYLVVGNDGLKIFNRDLKRLTSLVFANGMLYATGVALTSNGTVALSEGYRDKVLVFDHLLYTDEEPRTRCQGAREKAPPKSSELGFSGCNRIYTLQITVILLGVILGVSSGI